MRKRDSKGRFIKRSTSAHRSTRASEPARRKSGGHHKPKHHHASAPKARRGGGGRSRSRSTGGARTTRPVVNLAVVQPNASAREHRSTQRRSRSSSPRRFREPILVGGGRVALLGLGMVIGASAADMVGRFFNGMSTTTTSPTYPTPATGGTAISSITQYNAGAQLARPSWMGVGAQAFIALVGLLIGGFAKAPALKVLGWGFGLGALTTTVVKLLNAYAFEPLFVSTTAGARMYQGEYNANASFGTGPTVSPLTPTTMGQPQHTHGLPAAPQRLPTSFAAQRGAPPVAAAPPPFMGQPGGIFAPAQPAPTGTTGGTTPPPQQPIVTAPTSSNPAAPPGVGPSGGRGNQCQTGQCAPTGCTCGGKVCGMPQSNCGTGVSGGTAGDPPEEVVAEVVSVTDSFWARKAEEHRPYRRPTFRAA